MYIGKIILLTICLLGFNMAVRANQTLRWNLGKKHEIVWSVDKDIPHFDHIEMSGKRVSTVLRYGVDDKGAFSVDKSMIWPLLRTIPNNTHASLMRRYGWDILDAVVINGRSMTTEKVISISLDGVLNVESFADNGRNGKWKLIRRYFPSVELPSLLEYYSVINVGSIPLIIEIPDVKTKVYTDCSKGVSGSYRIEMVVDNAGTFIVQPGSMLNFGASITGYMEKELSSDISIKEEFAKRKTFIKNVMDNLVLDTPDDVIDQMFAFSKIRACESIYETKSGPMHGPGGESYYAAIWANDQAEYINPYFPFIGYNYGNASAFNSYMLFARYMNDEWKPIPSSIIAEGLDIWNGAGDRGDAAMIAYGASRYALARGCREEAEQLWPLITWCLEYCKKKINRDGVVTSDTDELENRFPSGEANLCTSSLYYDALLSASYLAKELQKSNKIAADYRKQAKILRKNIETYFGKEVEGFDTYAYYRGNEILRSWICIPLTVGIDERKDATIDALFSERLWTENGLLTQAGSKTFWDRSTLYALRGVYAVGETEKATEYLHRYSESRLLGEHVPYAIEAWPEGNQRHLSAESGLYGRIITEGLFGIRPVGLKCFMLTPRLPDKWNYMSLKNINAFGTKFDILVERLEGGKLLIRKIEAGRIQKQVIRIGDSVRINL